MAEYAIPTPSGRALLESNIRSPDEVSMANEKRIVQQRPDGDWEAVKAGHKRASAVAPTQAEVERRAKQIVAKAGGGEVIIKGRDGRIRDSDTVPPGRDPNPPKDRRH